MMASRKGGSRSSSKLENSSKNINEAENAVDPAQLMIDGFACETVVVEVIQEVCTTALDLINKRELEREGVPFTVANALRDIKRVCRLGFMSRETDSGELCVDGNFYNKFSGDWAVQRQDSENSKEDTVLTVSEPRGRRPSEINGPETEEPEGEVLDELEWKGATLSHQRWSSEFEPQPAIIDSWARGAVPMKPKHSAYDDAMSHLGKKSVSGTASDFDGKSFRSASRFSSKTRRIHANTDKNKSVLAPTQEHEQVMIIEIDTQDEDSLRRGLGPTPVFGNPNEMDFGEEDGEDPFMQDAKKLEELKANEQRRKIELEREEQELMALHEKTAKELKGKPFFFEPDGRLVVVRNVKGDALPPSSYTLPVQISDYVPEEEDGFDMAAIDNMSSARSAVSVAKSKDGKSVGSNKTKNTARGSIRGTARDSIKDTVHGNPKERKQSQESGGQIVSAEGSPGGKSKRPEPSESGSVTGAQRRERQRRRQERKEKRLSNYYEVSPSLQPSILTTMELSPGVSVNENGSVVTGPLPSEDPMKMTRKEYTLRHNMPQGTRQNTTAQKPLGASAGARKNSGLSNSQGPPGPASVTDSAITDPTAFMAFNDSLSADISPREENSFTSNPRTGRSAKTAAYTEIDEDDPHLQLIQSPGWGQNSVGEPTPPIRPNTKKTDAAFGLYTKKTRDRMHPDIITYTSEKKKLSAPPLGVTTGHGMSQLFDRALMNKSLKDTSSSRNLLFPPVAGAVPNPNSRSRRPSSDHSKGSYSSIGSSHRVPHKIIRQKSDDNIRTLLFD